jgi:hypothetical protein
MKKPILNLLLFFCLYSYATSVHSEELSPLELGFFLGASNPVPGTDASRVLDSSLGMGMFGRIQWPWILYTELGANYTTYLSTTERRLTTVPVYASLGYKLPLDLPISVFLKAGAGYAYTVARPANTATWNPMSVLGTEFSFVAGKKVRIGIRLDYQRIYETIGTERPIQNQIYTSPYEQDTRLTDPYYYKLKDADFFHFNLMLTLLL